MTDIPQGPLGPDDEDDLGEPVALLAELRQEPSTDFLGGIIRRIQRRNFAADASEFSWHGFTFVAVAFLGMFFQLFQTTRGDEGDE